jgi:outer membrane protein assembly factor BamB
MHRWLLTLVVAVLAFPVFADDWPQWLGPKRDGVWREDGLVEKFPPGGPKKVWSVKVGGGYAGPAVADDRVFVTDRTLDEGQKTPEGGFTVTEVGGGERVLCLDAKTGNELWKHSYPCKYKVQYSSGPRCTPTVDGDRVYTLGAMGDLRCLKVSDGSLVWKKNFVTDYEARVPVWGFAAHPLIDGDQLICLVGGSGERLVIAFDKKTGKEVWTSQSLMGDIGYCPPVIYTFGGTRTLVIWHTKAVVGLDPNTGQRLWRQPFEVDSALTAPTPRQLDGDRLLLVSFYNGSMMLKVGDKQVSVEWKSNKPGKHEMPDKTVNLHSIMATPAVKDGYIYGVCSYGELRCLKADTGERVWADMRATRGRFTPKAVAEKPTPSTTQPWSERWGLAFLIPQGDRFFLFNEQGELIIAKLSPKGYEEMDRAVILEPTNRMSGHKTVWMHPAFAGKKVFARNDEELVCVDLAK